MIFFVTAIGTDSGKTLASAILCESLQADYWKPIQAGMPSDTQQVSAWISNRKTQFHPEAYLFQHALSPHAAAQKENTTIQLEKITPPITNNHLVIEGAGGCLVPLNDQDFVIDIAARAHARIILVSNLYLGSINHTLLTLEALQKRNLKLDGIIFNGPSNKPSTDIILHHAQAPCLLHIKPEKIITPKVISHYADQLHTLWK